MVLGQHEAHKPLLALTQSTDPDIQVNEAPSYVVYPVLVVILTRGILLKCYVS